MEHSKKITELCQKFIDKKLGIIELQSRLETAIFPNDLAEFRHQVLNDLEEIRFTKLEDNYYDYGLNIVNKLLQKLD